MGRKISNKEAIDILDLSAEFGLVHAISNWQQGVDTICNCCRCCCLFFEAYHVLGHEKSHDVSNYIVNTRASTCKGCGLCQERCPMEALKLEHNPETKNKKGLAPSLNPELCIGCGVCVYKCPSGSLILKKRESIYDPPIDARDWMRRWFKDQNKQRE